MAGEKKRKPQTPAPEKSTTKKTKTSIKDFPSWDDHQGYTVAKLLNGQSVLFTGQALLTVLQGSVDVNGKRLGVGCAPLQLSTGGKSSGPAVTLTANSVSSQIPLAGNEVTEFTLQTLPPLSSPTPLHITLAPTGTAGANAASEPGSQGPPFSLHRLPGNQQGPQSTPSAPAPAPAGPRPMVIPPDWEQALIKVVSAAEASICSEHGPSPPPTIVLAGPKGAGKSSLARLLVNRLLNNHPVVAYLDTDCGQPELTPPGMMSVTLLTQPLLGPPSTHLRPASYAHYMGDTSPETDPGLYIRAVASLYRWYCSPECQKQAAALAAQASASGESGATAGAAAGSRKGADKASKRKAESEGATAAAPWPVLVANLHGWVVGLGCDLTGEVMRIIGPSHMLQVRAGPDHKNLPHGPFWWDAEHSVPAQQPCPTHIINLTSPAPHHHKHHHHSGKASQAEAEDEDEAGAGQDREGGETGGAGAGVGAVRGGGSSWLSAADSRALQWLAWAKAATGQDPARGAYDGADLHSTACALASTKPFAVSLDDVHVHFMHAQPPAEADLGYALNGVVVGLLAGDQQTVMQPGGVSSGAHMPAGVADQMPECVGVGLVRAVDMASRTLYLLTPASLDTLEQVTALSVGKSAGDQLPHALLHAGAAGLGTPYRTLLCLPPGGAGSAGAGTMKGGRRNLARSGLVATL